MAKTEVYSWRLTPHLKADLEEAARAESKSMAELLEQIAAEWLDRFRERAESEEERQRRLHEAAVKFVGSLRGDGQRRSDRVQEDVRARLARRHGR